MKVVTFKAEEDLIELLDSYSIRHKISRSEAIRRAVSKMVDEIRNENVQKAHVERMKL